MSEPRTTCPYDGAQLLASGVCTDTGGYPYGAKCPFACPVCRKPLAWSGLCEHCRGRPHADDPPCAPGDRWDMYDADGEPLGDGHHWRLVERGPLAFTPREEAHRILARLKQLTLGGVSVADALQALAA